MKKQLMRSTNEKMVAGVAGGVAEYLQVDPVIVRLVFALAILTNPPAGLLIYLLLALIMPQSEGAAEELLNPFDDEEIVIKNG